MRLVVAAHATGRLRFLTYPHRTGCFTSGSANLVLSMGGRLGVVQKSGVRMFKQKTWRVCVVHWRCAAGDHCIGETIFSLFPVAPMYEMRFSGHLLQLKHIQRSSCPTVTLAGALGPVCTCWSLDEVLARHFNARIQVFSCLRSVGQRYCDGVKSSPITHRFPPRLHHGRSA